MQKIIKTSFLFIGLILSLISSAENYSLHADSIDVIRKHGWNHLKTHQIMQKFAERLKEIEPFDTKSIDSLALMSLLNQHDHVLATINGLKNINQKQVLHHQLFSLSKKLQRQNQLDFSAAFLQSFTQIFNQVNEHQLFEALWHQGYDLTRGESYLYFLLDAVGPQSEDTNQEGMKLIKEYQKYHIYYSILPWFNLFIEQQLKQRFHIEENIIIKTAHGAIISGLMVRPRKMETPNTTILFSNIYTDLNSNRKIAIQAALNGYIGFVSDTRGKRLSPDKIEPYEHDGIDTHAVIDWISKQKWSNGQVGMYGGSYAGFAQWAAAKYHHPALKTIVPYVAAVPGQGLPMENNVFLTANYAWPFFVTNNQYLDTELYYDNDRWQQLNQKWFKSGKAFNHIDHIDGLDNPILQKHLKHPAYDEFWQTMVPYQQDYININIPVLSITGYYDDGQISALHYLNEHEKYNKNANHYLIIGPYDHFGAQSQPQKNLRGYDIDESAQINITDITFQWFDYIFKNKALPPILKDKINYQLMGSNTWQSSSSFQQLLKNKKRYYFHINNKEPQQSLKTIPQSFKMGLKQTIDFTDRNNINNQYYPWPIVKNKLDVTSGVVFMTETFDRPMEYSGLFNGEMHIKINKKDCDIGITLYEIRADGSSFHLGYFLGRASYAHDWTQRKLLTANVVEKISFKRSRMAAKLIEKGSRIAIVIDINKNEGAQVNYGTGKDVSFENINDADSPLVIEWLNSSFIDLPLKKVH